MRASAVRHGVFLVASCVLLLTGCEGARTLYGPMAGRDTPAALAQRLPAQLREAIAMTRADHIVPVQHMARIESWMLRVPAGTPLLYVPDNGYYPAVVDVFNDSSGVMVGQVAGSFEYLYNPCSDKAGNVYVPDFKSGYVYEIQHRTTNVIDSWSGNGNPIGCSVSTSGQLAVTAFHYGGLHADGAVIVYEGGGKTAKAYKGPADDFPATYDKAGDLFLEADYADRCTSPCLAELRKQSKSWQILSYDQTISFPGAFELMGSRLGVGDQEGAGNVTTIYSTTVSGTIAHNALTTTLNDGSCGAGSDVVGWANGSAKPNGLQLAKVTRVTGPNVLCGTIDQWKFPNGGNEFGYVDGALAPHGATLIR